MTTTPAIIQTLMERMNLRPDLAPSLAESLDKNRCFIVTRTAGDGHRYGKKYRTIQGTGETEQSARKTYDGWSAYSPILLHIQPDGSARVVAAYHRR